MLERLRKFLRGVFGSGRSSGGPTPTTTPGSTPSGPREPGNGVSSFHLWWQGADAGPPIVEVRATIEVLVAPTVNRLYFWALQATFMSAGRSFGAAHLGLQWNPRHPGSTAVNWGGYGDVGNVQSVLPGSPSPFPSAPNDPNTRDYPWRARVPYKLRISKGPQGWLGEITDTSSGVTQTVRELFAGGNTLTGAVVWAEVFAACDHPSTSVRWTDFVVVDAAGNERQPSSVRLTFPSGGDCPNSEVALDDRGLVQLTNAIRTRRDGEIVRLPAG